MSAKVILEITSGELSGKRFEFDEHDTFLFGRRKQDCHACSLHDPKVSRHHFLLEVNPPDARLRDLGSRNRTIVNGQKYGGREPHETPEEGKRKLHPEVDLKSGDLIQVGDTSMKFEVELPVDIELGDEDTIDSSDRLPTFQRTPTAVQRIVACQQCGENVADEAGPGRTGDYVCNACRDQLASDPMRHLRELIRQAGQRQATESTPEIPGYQVGSKLGDGGMGVVYKAKRLDDKRRVAVKLMLSRVAVDPHARASFLRECEVLGSLQHPFIVQLIKSDSIGSAFYFVMEYCNGGCLGDQAHRKGGRLSWRKLGPLMVQALAGLSHAHEQGYVHRDIKPQNILLDRDSDSWTCKIADFGLAKNFEKAGLSGFTKTGTIAGTCRFMPREQLTNYKYVRPVSDVWSIGATLYNLLTGDYPRDYPNGCDEFDVILDGKIIPVQKRDPQIPGRLAEVIDQSVADDPSDRFQTALEFQKALSEVLRCG